MVDKADDIKILNINVNDMGFSPYVCEILINNNIETVGDIVHRTKKELFSILQKNMAIVEVEKKLAILELSFKESNYDQKEKNEKSLTIFKSINECLKGMPKCVWNYYYDMKNNSLVLDSILIYLREIERFLIATFQTKSIEESDFEKITPEILKEYFSNMQSGNSTKASRWSALNSFYEFLFDSSIIKRNPLDKVDRPNENAIKTQQVFLSSKELLEFYNTMKANVRDSNINRDMAIFYLIAVAGLKASSIRMLDYSDVDNEYNLNCSGKVFKLQNKSKSYLQKWLNERYRIAVPTTALFVSQKKQRISLNAINEALKKYAKLCGINKNVTIEMLRTSFASLYLNANYSIDFVSNYLWHQDSKTTYSMLDDIQQNTSLENARETLNYIFGESPTEGYKDDFVRDHSHNEKEVYVEGKYKLEIKINLELTDEDIDDIMCEALEGGISYWCNKAEVVGDYLGDYASEQISRGGSLLLRDAEEGDTYELTLQKFIEGFKLWIAGGYSTHKAIEEGIVDCSEIGKKEADQIVQLALFEEIIYA